MVQIQTTARPYGTRPYWTLTLMGHCFGLGPKNLRYTVLHCLHYLHCLNCLHRTAGSYFVNYKNTVAQNNEYFSCRATLHLSCLENKIQRRLADKQNTEQRKMMSQFTHALQHPHLNTFYHLDEFLNLYIYTYGNV